MTDQRIVSTDRRRDIRRTCVFLLFVALAFAGSWGRASLGATAAQGDAGVLEVKFFFNTPSNVEPTYHTAIWLEDTNGKMAKTLYVSQELSDTQYKVGDACPDWVNKAQWEKAPKTEVAAVTAPTPSVGMGELRFDLATLGIAPGTYGFRFQVHVTDQYNVLYRGQVTVGGPGGEVKLETAFGPGKLDSTEQFVRDVEVRYLPAKVAAPPASISLEEAVWPVTR
jgi:hypothetical protein